MVFVLTAMAVHGAEMDDILAKAKEGDVVAQMQAAEKYATGGDVSKSAKDALEWYVKAAEQGNADAQLAAGKLLVGGKGVPKNSMEAAKWFLMAAEQGRAVAQVQIARMYLAGAGTVKDEVEAWKWASLAAAQGDRQATQILSFLRPKLSGEQLAKAEAAVKEYTDRKTTLDAGQGIPPVAPPIEAPAE